MKTKLFFSIAILLQLILISCNEKLDETNVTSNNKGDKLLSVSNNPYDFVGNLHRQGVNFAKDNISSFNPKYVADWKDSIDFQVAQYFDIILDSLHPLSNWTIDTTLYLLDQQTPIFGADSLYAEISKLYNGNFINSEQLYYITKILDIMLDSSYNNNFDVTYAINAIIDLENDIITNVSEPDRVCLLCMSAVAKDSYDYWYHEAHEEYTSWMDLYEQVSFKKSLKRSFILEKEKAAPGWAHHAAADAVGAVTGGFKWGTKAALGGALVFGPQGIILSAAGGAVIYGIVGTLGSIGWEAAVNKVWNWLFK